MRRDEGAVAAPTAGLHFTPELFAALEARGVSRHFVTLHVGAGTFLPVKAEDTDDHRMHAEWGTVSPRPPRRQRAQGARAAGSSRRHHLAAAARERGAARTVSSRPFSGDTAIFITPGYRFRAVDVLMTNFHLPRSTLFMLVSAFGGIERMRAAYAHAIETGYRFYSYGDGSLLFRAMPGDTCPADVPPVTSLRPMQTTGLYDTDQFTFTVSKTDGAARTGEIRMPRGVIRTPAFMPVGTAGDRQGHVSRSGEGARAPTWCSATPITSCCAPAPSASRSSAACTSS